MLERKQLHQIRIFVLWFENQFLIIPFHVSKWLCVCVLYLGVYAQKTLEVPAGHSLVPVGIVEKVSLMAIRLHVNQSLKHKQYFSRLKREWDQPLTYPSSLSPFRDQIASLFTLPVRCKCLSCSWALGQSSFRKKLASDWKCAETFSCFSSFCLQHLH